MAKLSRVHSGKAPKRRHFIAEWAEKRGLRQTDIARELDVDKSVVNKWFNEQNLPRQETLERLAALMSLEDYSDLFRNPDDDWQTRFFERRRDELLLLTEDRTEEEIGRMIDLIKLAFPQKQAGQ